MRRKNDQPVRTKELVGFALSFLDVLSCGLGSAILLLLVLPHGPSIAAVFVDKSLADRIEQVTKSIELKQVQEQELRSEIQNAQQNLNDRASAIESLKQSRASRAEELHALLDELASAREAQRKSAAGLSSAQQERTNELAAMAAKKEKLEKLGSQGQGSHLTGIAIAESRVAILLDRSASMLNRKLVEIIRLRVSSKRRQQNSAKWQSARAAAQWAYSEIPVSGLYRIFSFSDSVTDIDGTEVSATGKLDWHERTKERTRVAQQIDAVAAKGATDLQRAFDAIVRLDPKPRQVILITDGLPTVPGDKRLRSIRKCPSKPKQGTAILSPACRANIFQHAARFVDKRLPTTQFHVVLLPLEGDASAASIYWEFVAYKSGRVLAPAEGWPLL